MAARPSTMHPPHPLLPQTSLSIVMEAEGATGTAWSSKCPNPPVNNSIIAPTTRTSAHSGHWHWKGAPSTPPPVQNASFLRASVSRPSFASDDVFSPLHRERQPLSNNAIDPARTYGGRFSNSEAQRASPGTPSSHGSCAIYTDSESDDSRSRNVPLRNQKWIWWLALLAFLCLCSFVILAWWIAKH